MDVLLEYTPVTRSQLRIVQKCLLLILVFTFAGFDIASISAVAVSNGGKSMAWMAINCVSHLVNLGFIYGVLYEKRIINDKSMGITQGVAWVISIGLGTIASFYSSTIMIGAVAFSCIAPFISLRYILPEEQPRPTEHYSVDVDNVFHDK
mgnify:CR=1 FL=1